MGPTAVFGDWKVHYSGQAAKMFGSFGRGSFATKAQCESYRISRPGFESNNSYCSGFDTKQSNTAATGKQKKANPGKTNATQDSVAIQPQPFQINPQQSQFAKDKDELLKSIKMPAPNDNLRPGGTSFFGLGGGKASSEAITEQDEFEKMNELWLKKQKKLIEQRLREPNKWSNSIYKSLKTKRPPLPYKTFDELQPGDTLLIEGSKIITVPDQVLSGKKVQLTGPPSISHTVLYLKELNGKKLFLDNQPGEGPRIVPEDYILQKYGSRGVEVAKLAQPLNKEEADRLYTAAREMRAKNVKKMEANKWFDETTYGAWGKDNVVCSESDWALIRASGREIPASDDLLKKSMGVNFSPQDFYSEEQYFLVSPLAMP
ncbi:MAG TPA: hypothetical protein VHO90_19000 [Bacteroidales bacterium]|nr:hypothetical protein [Bacteroidales bacterium]